MRGTASDPHITRGLRAGRGALLVAITAVALAACGSSSPGSTSAKTSTSASGKGMASKTPVQIVAAAQSALRSASGFVVAGTLKQGSQQLRLDIVEGGAKGMQVHVSENGKNAEIIALPNAAYVRANEAFLKAQAAPNAAVAANHWIELPASESQQLTSGFGPFAPDRLAQCLGENLGTLSRDGTTTVGGKPAIVVRQAGNAPGSNPGTLAVASTGPAYPLRVTSTGPTRPGGKVDACNTGKANDVQGTITLSQFNHVPPSRHPSIQSRAELHRVLRPEA